MRKHKNKFPLKAKSSKQMERDLRIRRRNIKISEIAHMILFPFVMIFRPIVRYFFYQYVPDTRPSRFGTRDEWIYWRSKLQWERMLIWATLIFLLIAVL